MPTRRLDVHRPIYFPGEGRPLRLQLDSNPGMFTIERIALAKAEGVPITALLDRTPSTMGDILEKAEEQLPHKKIVLVATWPEHSAKPWTREFENPISRAELVIEAAQLLRDIIEELESQGHDPFIEDALKSRHPVRRNQIVLMNLQRTSNEEDDQEQWWQTVISIDIGARNTSVVEWVYLRFMVANFQNRDNSRKLVNK
ncbi:hypothetical protein APHAL10511_008616 [Amanita phalloides]|nr:hypothetical protein APHAL10511_008616 [Amanita phalloides]